VVLDSNPPDGSSILVRESGELILLPIGLYVGDFCMSCQTGLDFEGKLTRDLSMEKYYHFLLYPERGFNSMFPLKPKVKF
jgi:hypothetical protein